MSSLALYRKYRSGSFDDVIGQEHITQSLRNAVKNSRISHAYLFTGPRGVGKTSIARILAHEINEIEYDPIQTSHLDIIEIDAASNNKVDDIRELREKIHSAPTKAKYKVYIIDEVHMLSNSAFNALLKTLEEPPSHAVFIMATTEAHKLPDTIVSRTQRFTFYPIDLNKVKDHLAGIANEEGLEIEEDALMLLAEKGEGSLRDSISLLDQVINLHEGKVTREKIENMLGMLDQESIIDITDAIAKSDSEKLFKYLSDFSDIGINAVQVADQLIELWRHLSLIQVEATEEKNDKLKQLANNLNHRALLSGIDKLLEVGRSSNSQVALELSLLKMLNSAKASKSSNEKKFASQTKTKRPVRQLKDESDDTNEDVKPKQKEKIKNNNSKGVEISKEEWLKIIFSVKEKSNQLYTVLRLGQMEVDKSSNTVILRFRFPFHKRRVEEVANKKLIQNQIEEVVGQSFAVKCEVAGITHQENEIKDDNEADEPSEEAKNVLNVFKGGEIINE